MFQSRLTSLPAVHVPVAPIIRTAPLLESTQE